MSAAKKVQLLSNMHEDQFDVVVDGESIAQFNYDSHGSQGMRDVKTLIQRLGIALNFEVQQAESE